MRLINDQFNDCWIWVDEHDKDIELSPHFDYEEDAIQWYNRIAKSVLNIETK